MEFINEMYVVYNPFINAMFNISTKAYTKINLLKDKIKKRGEKKWF